MADSIARSHLAHSSIRGQTATRRKQAQGGAVKAKEEAGKKRKDKGDRQFVKAVLESPLVVRWGEAVGEEVVGLVCGEVGGVRGFYGERERRRRATAKPTAPAIPIPTAPPILATLTFGLNETIKRLERTLLDLEISVDALLAGYSDFPFPPHQDGLIPTAPVPGPSRLAAPPPPPLRAVFVCVDDINPRELVDHVPGYVTSWNALVARSKARLEEWARAGGSERREKMDRLMRDKEMWLVPLKKGSEQVLAHAVGLRRVSVMGVTNDFPNLSKIIEHLTSINIHPPMPPFPLHPSVPLSLTSQIYAPTLLKAVHTTIPADPKARKARRVDGVRRARDEQKRKRREDVARTRKTVGWKVGDKWYGGSEQKKRDREQKWQGRQRVREMVVNRQRKKAVKTRKGKEGKESVKG